MTLELEISALKAIDHLKISLPLVPGLYAFTGENGCGKSTLMAVIANLFYNNIFDKYFHKLSTDAVIDYKIDSSESKWTYHGGQWTHTKTNGGAFFNGLYEGSIIHGNRFRDNNYKSLFEAEKVDRADLKLADDTIRQNFNYILHGDVNYYEKLYIIDRKTAGAKYRFGGVPFFIERGGTVVSQFDLSTGENLVLSLLYSVNLKIGNKKFFDPSLILIDEVELALHPSSIVRLLQVLKKLSTENQLIVYFSTHSIELVRNIRNEDTFFLKRGDKEIEVVSPCYPAYATRSLFFHDGFDFCILVEDFLARYVVQRIINEESLHKSKLIHILPAGGWTNVLSVHEDIQRSNLLGYGKKVISILDGDVEGEFNKKFKIKGQYSGLQVNFLPIQSLEKYLKTKLVDQYDKSFSSEIGDLFFRRKSIDEIIFEYKNRQTDDKSGKILFEMLNAEILSFTGVTSDYHNELVKVIFERESYDKLKAFLRKAL